MKQSLQLKIGQQLTMTPQLQQAIKLLQLSTLDLQQEIQQALDSNPMLEVNEDLEDDRDKTEAANNNDELIDLSKNSEPSKTTQESEETHADGDWQENKSRFALGLGNGQIITDH